MNDDEFGRDCPECHVHAGFCGYDTRRTGVFIAQVTRMVDE